jgi:HK97 family phage prohead protease
MTITETPLGAVEERRSVGTIEEVRPRERVITIIAMPYDVETHRANGAYVESFAPGAFAGIERRNGQIRVNREHVLAQPVGRVTRWVPDRPDALLGELKVSKTVLGDETLELASDGILDASVGFLPMKHADGTVGEVWSENRTKRRVTRAWLHHLALTTDPAYEGARVLDVRTAAEPPSSSATPARDEMMALLRERGHLPAGYV